MRRSERGAILAAAIFMLAVMAAAAAAFFVRQEAERRREIATEQRDRAMWLARSGARLGQPKELDLTSAGETLHLSVKAPKGKGAQPVVAEVSGPRTGTARVEATIDGGRVTAWTESFSRPGAPTPASPTVVAEPDIP